MHLPLKKSSTKNCSSSSVSCNCYYANTTSNMPIETWMAQQHLLVLCVASCKIFRFAHRTRIKIMTEGERTFSLFQNEPKFSYQILVGEHGQVWPLWLMAAKNVSFLWVGVGQHGDQYSEPCLDSHMKHQGMNWGIPFLMKSREGPG